jgi:hypothetical protein
MQSQIRTVNPGSTCPIFVTLEQSDKAVAMAFWRKGSRFLKEDDKQEQIDPDELVILMAQNYCDDLDNGLSPDFHGSVFLTTALVLSSVREVVSPVTWLDRILSIAEPSANPVEAANSEAEKINRLLLEKGVISDRIFRNITQLTAGHIERLRALWESQDDIEMYGRAEKAQYSSTLRMRDAMEASAFFQKLDSEAEYDDDGTYSGEQFEVMCPHENLEFPLLVSFSIESFSLRYRRLLWIEFEVCGDYSPDFNRAHLIGPGWSARIFGLPPCCRDTFEAGVFRLHEELGGEILVVPE